LGEKLFCFFVSQVSLGAALDRTQMDYQQGIVGFLFHFFLRSIINDNFLCKYCLLKEIHLVEVSLNLSLGAIYCTIQTFY